MVVLHRSDNEQSPWSRPMGVYCVHTSCSSWWRTRAAHTAVFPPPLRGRVRSGVAANATLKCNHNSNARSLRCDFAKQWRRRNWHWSRCRKAPPLPVPPPQGGREPPNSKLSEWCESNSRVRAFLRQGPPLEKNPACALSVDGNHFCCKMTTSSGVICRFARIYTHER
jgi:hypothetical protein